MQKSLRHDVAGIFVLMRNNTTFLFSRLVIYFQNEIQTENFFADFSYPCARRIFFLF